MALVNFKTFLPFSDATKFSFFLSFSLFLCLLYSLSHTLDIFSSVTYIIFESYNGNMMWFGVFQI